MIPTSIKYSLVGKPESENSNKSCCEAEDEKHSQGISYIKMLSNCHKHAKERELTNLLLYNLNTFLTHQKTRNDLMISSKDFTVSHWKGFPF